MAYKRILFVIKKRLTYGSYGISFGLLNSAKFVAEKLDEFPNVEAKVVEVVDNNAIDREVTLYKPTHVIIEAIWVVPEKFNILIARHPTVEWSVRIHSKPTFLANEGIAFDWIGRYVDIGKRTGKLTVSTNNREFSRYLSSIYGYHFAYTPNIYPQPYRNWRRKAYDPYYVDIGLWGAQRPMKNGLTQALAAIAFAKAIGKHLRFHINADRVEQRGEEVLKNLRALFRDTPNTTLVEHPWVNHDEFLMLVAAMDLNMQVSVSETYNIVSADSISVGVPVLVCKDIEFAPSFYKVSATSLESIRQGLHTLYNVENPLLTYYAKYKLAKSNQRALEAWRLALV